MILLLKIFSIVLFTLYISGNIYLYALMFGPLAFLNITFAFFDNFLSFKMSIINKLLLIIMISSLIFALYLSYSCNNNTLNILHIILAILFYPFYIIYQAIKTNFFGILV